MPISKRRGKHPSSDRRVDSKRTSPKKGCLLAFIAAMILGLTFSPGASLASDGRDLMQVPQLEVSQDFKCRSMCPGIATPAVGFEGESPTPVGLGADEIQDAYDIPTTGGSDKTVAITVVGRNPNAEKNLEVYRTEYGLPPCTKTNGCFHEVNETGGSTLPSNASSNWIVETALDLEMVSAACPECSILLVDASSTASLPTAAETAADLGATAISNSWIVTDDASNIPCNSANFEYPGVVVTAASGDDGYLNYTEPLRAGGASYPAACPGVVSVGGTELTKAPDTPRGWIDNVWPESGGGCSKNRAKPIWQKDSGCAKRMTNDIAIVAEDVAVYEHSKGWLTSSGGTKGAWGTSIGAPLIAGLYAQAVKPVRDEPLKSLYKGLDEGWGNIYDVGPTGGLNNTNYQGHSCSPLYLCNAVAGQDGKSIEGYDGPTGVGVPQGIPILVKWIIASANGVQMGSAAQTEPEVDCPSTTLCFAVGSEGIVSGSPLAAEWDGNEWTDVSTPYENEAFEELGRLRDVSCPTVKFCMAVGEYNGGSSESYVIRWDGYTWELDESAPRLLADDWTGAFSISCGSPSDCMIVGGDGYEAGSLVSAHWSGGGWSTPEVPFPGGTEGARLEKVSCAAEEVENGEEEVEESEVCLAVGSLYSQTTESFEVFVERWNGSSWSIDSSLTPPGYQSGLDDVSCPSVNSCMAVGWMAESPENEKYEDTVPLAEHWNGAEWVLGKPPLPGPPEISGPIGFLSPQEREEWEEQRELEEEGELYGVSCATPTSCTAVGINFGTGHIIDGWNGTSWSVQEAPESAAGSFHFAYQVDCATVGVCQEIGSGGGFSFSLLTEDESPSLIEGGGVADLSPGGATLGGIVNPQGSPTTYQYEYGTTTSYGSKAPASPKSIGSGTSVVEVSEKIEGLAPETTYHFRLVATNEKGTVEGEDQTFTTPGWKTLSTPNPSGASDSNLHDVSCEPSTSVCTAVGKSTKSGADSPLAQRWNGTSWSEQSPAKKSGTLPTRLFGVDCPSETRCLAAGNYQPSEGGPTLLTEIWNENKWNVQSTPVPSEASSSELVGIGCSSTAECKAVGSAVIGGVKTAIAEKWTSPTWALESIPIPEGAISSQLDGVDCNWSNFCVAVGRYTTSGAAVKSLAMFWNGSWSLPSLTAPEGAVETTLLDVSCTKSPSRCMAVGGWKNSEGEQFTLAYRFNGTSTWTLQSTPNPPESIESLFQDVSCATETSCTAAGSSVGDESIQTLAEKWNGTSWSIQGTPNPSGSTFSSLFGVSCQSTTCMGVGWSTDGSGVDTTLGEIRE